MSRSILFGLFVLAFGTLAIPASARAEEANGSLTQAEKSKQAQVFADLAYVAYERQDWGKAVAMYMESYKLVPTADVLFNIATLYDRKIGNKRLALDFYQRHNAAADANSDLVSKAIARIAELNHEEPAVVQQKAAALPPEAPPPTNKRRAFRVAGLVTGLVGLAGIGIGIGFGVDALGKSNDAKNAGCANGTCLDPFSASKERSAFTSATVSTVGLVVGGALTVVGVTLILVAPKKEAPKAATLQLTPSVGAGSFGFSFSGTMF